MTREEIAFIIETLQEVIEWAEYAPQYFQDKHGLQQDKNNVDKAIYSLRNFESRTCENCKYFNLETGKQPDGLSWEKIECEQGTISQCMEADYSVLSCKHWKQK